MRRIDRTQRKSCKLAAGPWILSRTVTPFPSSRPIRPPACDREADSERNGNPANSLLHPGLPAESSRHSLLHGPYGRPRAIGQVQFAKQILNRSSICPGPKCDCFWLLSSEKTPVVSSSGQPLAGIRSKTFHRIVVTVNTSFTDGSSGSVAAFRKSLKRGQNLNRVLLDLCGPFRGRHFQHSPCRLIFRYQVETANVDEAQLVT